MCCAGALNSIKIITLMKELKYSLDKRKEFLQHPLFSNKVLIVNLVEDTASFDSEFVMDYVNNIKN